MPNEAYRSLIHLITPGCFQYFNCLTRVKKKRLVNYRIIIFLCHQTASKRLPSVVDFLNEQSVEGTTALHMACVGGRERVGDLLLRHGADHEAVNFVSSASALHIAAKYGHLSMVELLVLYGSVINSRDGKLRTALHMYSSIFYTPPALEKFTQKM